MKLKSTVIIGSISIIIAIITIACMTERGPIGMYDNIDLTHPKKSDAPKLVGGIKEKDPEIRLAVIYALQRLGPDAADAIPQLIEHMEDTSETMESSASSFALSTIGSLAVSPLIGQLDNSNGSFRAMVVYTLGEIGPDAGSALTELKGIYENDPYVFDNVYLVREAAGKAIKKIKGE